MMKPNTTQQQQSVNRFSQYPIIGSFIWFFSADSRMKEAQRVLRDSREETERIIEQADRSIADGAQLIASSQIRLKETDDAIAESRTLRK